jgi:NAD(P)-dependent dehydrogenase (short-subunit alcohol dehydrogenase family)
MSSTLIITGAGGNLGKVVTTHLAHSGYTVEATLGPREKVSPFASEPAIHTQQVDLFDAKPSEHFVQSVYAKHSAVRAAILLVGGFKNGRISDITSEDLFGMYKLNFESAYNIVRPLLPHFEKQPEGGQIILVGSRAPLNPAEGKNYIAYALSKSLIFKLSELINAEYRHQNISSCVILPSTIDTPDNRKSMPDADFSRWVPAGKIAETIAFLLTDTGRMIRETVIKIYNRA